MIGTICSLLASPLLYVILRLLSYTSAEAVRMLIWWYGRGWVTLVSLFMPVSLPSEEIPSPCILTINHTSFFDVYFMGGQPNWNTAIAVREWPFKIPFYKPFMQTAGYIRTENSSPDNVIEESLDAIHQGASIIFFPEGTRAQSGELQRFYSGAFKVSVQANIPVVPLCISGTRDFLPRGSWILHHSPITVSLLPPVYPANFSDTINPHGAMRREVKRQMQNHLDILTT